MTIQKNESFRLFDEIALTYDRVNRIMTFGMDKKWRKKLFSFLPNPCAKLLDGATGTADQIFFLLDKGLSADEIVGIDLSEEMLKIGNEKLQLKAKHLPVTLKKASLLSIPYPDSYFTAATVSFGVRNVLDLALCLKELYRVIEEEGVCLILESSKPSLKPVALLHKWYMKKIMPSIGAFFSKNKKAYQYLHTTTDTFPSGKEFLAFLKTAGFKQYRAYPLSFGAVTLYVAKK